MALTADYFGSYGVQIEEGSQKFPAIQATNYKPQGSHADVSLCLSETSISILGSGWKDYFSHFATEVFYGSEQETVYQFPAQSRFIFLGFPKTFAQNKETKQISRLQRGVNLQSINAVTATRCLVACLIDDQLVTCDDGSVQLFTLKLTSTKTKLIDAYREPEYRSLKKMNSALIEAYKLKRQSWIHLVSIGLKAVPHCFTSQSTNQSSWGVLFELEGNASPLTDELKQQMFHLVQSDEVRGFLSDPFGLDQKDDDVNDPAFVEQAKSDLGLSDPASDRVPF